MRILAVALAALLLTSCGSGVRGRVPAGCDAMCFAPCVGADGDTGVRWEADPADPGAFDALGGDVTPALAGKLRTCELRRRACAECLQRLDKHGVIAL